MVVPLIPSLRRQRKAHLYYFNAVLACIASSQGSQDYIARPVLRRTQTSVL